MQIENVIESYNEVAAEYDEILQHYWHIEREPLIAALELSPGQTVLDAAVGTGLNLPAYPSGVRVVGIDLAQKMLNEARKKPISADVTLQIMDLHQLDFPDDSFDAAASGYTLCVVKDPVCVLREILRVTKQGAKIVILDYCKSRNPDIGKWQELISDAAAKFGFPMGKIKWDTLMDYDRLLYNSNLPIEVIQDERIDSPNPFLCGCQVLLKNCKD